MPQVMERQEELLGYKLNVLSFVLGGHYYAKVYSVEHVREIARAEGSTREAAEEQALQVARQCLV